MKPTGVTLSPGRIRLTIGGQQLTSITYIPPKVTKKKVISEIPLPPVLNVLTLSANIIAEASGAGAVVGAIQNTTAGSTVTLTGGDGCFTTSLVSDVWYLVTTATKTDYETKTSHSVDLTEDLDGTIKTTAGLVINVSNVFEAPNLAILSLSSSSFTLGVPASGTIDGATAGSTITATGAPAGLIIDGSARTWSWSGSGAESSGNLDLDESLADSANSPRKSTVGWAILAAAPVLATLALSANSVTENSPTDTVIGDILNLTSGSTPSLSDDAGGRFKVAQIAGVWKIAVATVLTDYEAATSHPITIVETLAGATGSPKSTTLTIGIVNQNDTSPTAFTLAPANDAALNTVVTSAPITIAGLGASDSATATISGAASSEVQKNGGAWGAGPLTVVNGDTLAVRHTSSSSNSTATSTTLTVAGVSSTFTSTTIASDAVNTVAPAITGTRGGTLTATPGTWTGATSVSGQWYADGVATGNTTTSFTDSDTSKSLEYRETALPGNVVASGYKGASVDTGYFDNFDTYADGTRLAERYNSGSITNFVATATPHVAGWDAVGNVGSNPDTDSTGWVQQLRIFGGKVQQTYNNTSSGQSAIVRDFGSLGGIWDFTLSWGPKAATAQERALLFSVNATSTGASPTFIRARCRFANFNNTIVLEGTGLTATTVNLPSDWVDGDVLRVKIDATGKLIYFFRNGTAVGNAGGYSLAAFTGVWTSKAGFQNCYTTNVPPPGENIASALSYNSLSSNNVTSAVINQQSGGSPWQKQIDITASVPAVEATGAQYKVETEAGQLVQNWTAMVLASGTATGSCLLGDHAFEGQKFRVLVRNVGGTVSTAWGLTAVNGYVLQQQMLVGMNDSDWTYWGGQTIGRDAFEILSGTAGIGIIAANPTTADRQGLMRPGLTQHNYKGWAEAYNASLNYPVTTGSDDHNHCRYQGLSWQTTDNTSKIRSAPNTANTSGAGGDWKLASSCADASLVGLTADGVPTKLPDDPNLTIYFEYLWYVPKGRAPFTVACKTQPGIAVKLFTASLGTVTLTQSSADIAAGQFTLSFSAAAETTGINGMLYIDRANCTATLNSNFFLSGIPSYETGTPSADIGVPYASVDKLSDLDAFAGIRYVKGAPIERSAGNWAGTMTAANNTVSGVCRQWKYMIDTAQRLGHKYIKLHVPDIADTSYMTAQATYFRDHCDPTIKIHVARSNEDWNPALYQNAVDLHAEAVAAGISDIQMYARKFNAMVAVWKSVFGAAYDSRVVSVFEWQAPTSTTTWAQGLDFENCYQNVGALSIAPYFEGGIGGYNIAAYSSTPDTASAQDLVQNAVAASDQTAFNNALDTRLTKAIDASVAVCAALYAWLPGYSISKGLSPNAIGLEYYEGGQHIAMTSANLAAWDSGISAAGGGSGGGARAASYFKAYKRSAKMGAKTAYYIDQLAQKAPGILNFFCYAGGVDVNTGTGWGSEDTTGNVTQEPFATLKTKAEEYNLAA